MSSKAFVTLLVLLPIVLSAMQTAIVGRPLALILNVVLGVFLILGHNWARWVMLVRCGFGFIADASALFALKNFDGSAIMLILLVLLILSNIATYLVLGATLLLSKRVNEHFNT